MARVRMTTTNRSSATYEIKGVLVDPSSTNWVCVVTDTAGNIVFSARGSDAVSRFFAVQDSWTGLNVTTATNLTAVYFYY